MVYKPFTALQSITLNIQSKVIRKLFLRGMRTDSVSRYNILNQESVNNINQVHAFIVLYDSQEVADELLANTVKLVSKVAVLFWNDLLSEEEEQYFLNTIDSEKATADAFLQAHSNMLSNPGGKPDCAELLAALDVLQQQVKEMLAVKYSAKTQECGVKLVGYLQSEEMFQFLLTDEAAAPYLAVAVSMMESITANHKLITSFMKDRRSKSKRSKKIRKMSKDIQKEVFSNLSDKLVSESVSEFAPSALVPSEEMIGERAMLVLGSLHKFIELESKDEKKADDLIANILTIVAKMEAAYSADIFTDEDQQNLVEMIGVTRSLLLAFVALGNSQEDSNDLSKLLDYYDKVEEGLCSILRSHFGGNTLSRVHSLFYYFKKPEVHVFFFKEMDDDLLRKSLMEVFTHLYDEMPAAFLTEGQR